MTNEKTWEELEQALQHIRAAKRETESEIHRESIESMENQCLDIMEWTKTEL